MEARLVRRRHERAGFDAAGGRPDERLPAGVDRVPAIRHIVVLMMENHSYDNYLGAMTDRGDGLPVDGGGRFATSNPASDGRRRRAAPAERHRTTTAAPMPELGGIASAVGRRRHGRVRPQRRTGGRPARPAPGGGRRLGHGPLGAERPPLLLGPGPHVPRVRPVVRLLSRADVPEPAVPHRRHGPRPHDRRGVEVLRYAAVRDDPRSADPLRHHVGELPQHRADAAGAVADARPGRAPGGRAHRTELAARRRRDRARARVEAAVHRRRVRCQHGAPSPARAGHQALLRRRRPR